MSGEEMFDEQPRKRVRLSTPTKAVPSSGSNHQLGAIEQSLLRDENANTRDVPFEGHTVDPQLEKEIKAGITAYVRPDTPGFTGILKQRYTDFLVNEILPNGQVLHLDSFDVPSSKKASEERSKTETSVESVEQSAISDAGGSGVDRGADGQHPDTDAIKTSETSDGKDGPELPAEDIDTLHSIFGEKITLAIVRLYHKVLSHPDRKPKDFNAVISEPIEDKDQRTNAHQLIRRIFSSRLDTNTDKDNSIVIKPAPPANKAQRWQRSTAGGRGKGKLGWDELGGEYLHFTLYKENKDTMEVIYYIASQLKLHVKNFQFAGTKDRRGVTVQRVSVYRVHAERLAAVGRNLRNAKIGGFQYCPNGLELGDLKGNEFVITLRDCHFSGEEGLSTEDRLKLAENVVSKAVDEFKRKGFINFYGLQRFGSFSAGTDIIGVKLLQEDLKGAIDHILEYSPSALAAAQDPNSTELISSDDKARAEALHIWKTAKKAGPALEKLPGKFSAEANIIKHLGHVDRKTGQLSRINDYQGALQMIQRNLRLMYVHAYQSLVWNVVASKRWGMYGDKVIEGDLVITSEHKQKEAGHTEREDIDDQGEVIIRPSTDDSAADTDGGYVRARPLTREEAESGDYSIFDVVLPLPGFDVEYPRNAIGEFYKTFMASERGGGLDPHNMRRKWKDISLSGGYRKLLSRPGQDMSCEVRPYEKDDEQMVETDLEKLLKKKGGAGDGGPDVAVDAPRMEGVQESSKLAVVLNMQLGSSQYATMALRELMKDGVKVYKPDYGSGR